MSSQKVGVVGTGVMASGTIVLLICNRYPAVMLGRSQASWDRGLAAVNGSMDALIREGLMTETHKEEALTYLTVTQKYEDLADCAVVFECAVETLDTKKDVMAHLEAVCPAETIIGSTTSDISAIDIAAFITHKERFMVSHSWNPPHLIPLVEIVKSEYTSQAAVDAMVTLLEDLGRVPVVLMKDARGFIGNRLHHALFREALYMIQEGIATPEYIDKTFMNSMAPRYSSIGLMEYFDSSDYNLNYSIQNYLLPQLCRDTSAMPVVVKYHTEEGRSTRHMMDWSKKDIADYEDRKSRPFYRFATLKITEPQS